MKLYQITEQYKNIAELLETPDFEDNTDIIAALDSIQDDFDKKAVQVVYNIKNTEAEVEMIDREIKRLQDLKKRHKKRVTRQADEAEKSRNGLPNFARITLMRTTKAPLPWIVDAVEEQLSSSAEFWQAYRRSDWAAMKSIRESVV